MRDLLVKAARAVGRMALTALLILAGPAAAFADGGVPTPTPSSGSTGVSAVDINSFFTNTDSLVHTIALFLFSLIAVVFVISITINSIRLMAGAHDPQKRTQAMTGYAWTTVAGIAAFAASYWASLAYGAANTISGH